MIMETNECMFHFMRKEDLNLLPDEDVVLCKMFNGCYEALHVSTRDDFIVQYERFRHSISDSLWICEKGESKKTDTIPDVPLIFYEKDEVTEYGDWFGNDYSIVNDDIELVAHIEGPILEALLNYYG